MISRRAHPAHPYEGGRLDAPPIRDGCGVCLRAPGVTLMKLVGLLDACLGDPALAAARDLAASGAGQVDLTAPAALRPFVVAALAGHNPVLQPQLKKLGDLEPVELHQGGEADLEEVVRQLSGMAYARVDLVEKRGEFAVRGGILDVFPPTEEHPLRVEFWGDEVEEIRSF